MAHTPLANKLAEACSVAAEAARRNVPAGQIIHERAQRRLDRREFLTRTSALAAAAVGGLVLPKTLSAASPKGARVAIVGAGLAGLTCAYRLHQAGIAATVYEANTRLGGRCWTLRDYFAEGQIAEHGGELIDQSHSAIRQLAQELGLATDNLLQAEANGTEPCYYFDGAPYTYEEATDDLKQIWQKLHRDLSEASYPTLYNNYTQRGWELDHLSIIDWINETVPGGIDSRLGQLLNVAYNIEYGGECDRQSSLNLLYLLGYTGPGKLRIFGQSNEKYHVRGGNERIVARLAAALTNQIVVGTALVALARTSSGAYALTLQSGRRASTVTVDKVVLALPFSILKTSVDLSDAGFSALKMTAINQLSMGTNSKLALQFNTRSWRALGCNGETYSDRGYQASWEVSRAQSGTAGILVDYTGGNIGASFNTGTPASRAQEFLQQIEPVLPGLSSQWNGRVALDYWTGNPYSRGSYSFWKVGEYTSFVGVEREQEGNCHFAGEHTSIDAQGYLEGAVETGERAAGEVIAELS